MNYYRRYSGDYLRKTSRLSLVEHGAYTLMLDYYYTEQQPLPLDHEEIYTMVRAMKPPDRAAVDKILEKFFERRSDGYHNSRADEELGKATPLIEAARENGRKGGRRRNPPDNPVGSGEDNPSGNPVGCESMEPTGGANGQHPPSSNHQPPSANPLSTTGKALSRPNGHDVLPRAREVLNFLNSKAGRNYKPVEANLRLITARIKDGATEQELRQVIAKKCREWIGDPKMAEYLRPKTLFNATNFAQYQGELGHGE